MKLFKNVNFDKLKSGLNKTRDKIFNSISETFSGKAVVDEEILDELEEILVTSDIGIDIALEIIEKTRTSLRNNEERTKEAVLDTLQEELSKVLSDYSSTETEYEGIVKFKPYVILIIGVNGAGKTTTIGKLAYNYKKAGFKVVIGAADTFRAAANEQLEVWADRAGVDIVSSEQGRDPSSVVFNTLEKAKNQKADIVLIDTAGRLHNKSNLMEELGKIKRVMAKVIDHAPNETFLVVDGNTGQNALIQAREFAKVTDISGLIITKLDGTAKGGMVFQICKEQKIPLRYIGVGEGITDLQTFEPELFAQALFNKNLKEIV